MRRTKAELRRIIKHKRAAIARLRAELDAALRLLRRKGRRSD
jgi:hypothetical protein